VASTLDIAQCLLGDLAFKGWYPLFIGQPLAWQSWVSNLCCMLRAIVRQVLPGLAVVSCQWVDRLALVRRRDRFEHRFCMGCTTAIPVIATILYSQTLRRQKFPKIGDIVSSFWDFFCP
jgi:hypothetical protein